MSQDGKQPVHPAGNKHRSGKIVINHDEWTLSDAGFGKAPDAGRFAANVAGWFAPKGKPGAFLVYSTNFGLTGKLLASALQEAGHTVTVNAKVPFTVASLSDYDGVFLSGNSADNNVLIDYVKSGGSVYLAAGTGWGGASVEAGRWKAFLNAFGFRFEPRYNGVGGNQAVTGDHPVLAGVKTLYCNNGNSIVDIEPESRMNHILVSRNNQGLIAVYDMSLATVDVAITNICYDGKVKRTESDEFVEITNHGSVHADISGWKLYADDARQEFVFPAGTKLKSGQSVRVYTNEQHADTGGFSFGIGRAIWNNQGDTGLLSDAEGVEISRCRYPIASQDV